MKPLCQLILTSKLCQLIWNLIFTGFGITFFVFIILQVLFSGLLYFGVVEYHWPEGRPLDITQLYTTFLAVCVHILVGVNTIFFFVQSLDPYAHVSRLHFDDQGRFKKRYVYFTVSLVIAVMMSAASACLLIFSPFAWVDVLVYNEYITVALFLVFVVADYWLIQACEIALAGKVELESPDRDAMTSFKHELQAFMHASDGPGFIGMILILVMSTTMKPKVLDDHYWQGFITGAMGLHLTFSQATVAFLNVLLKTKADLHIVEQLPPADSGNTAPHIGSPP